MTLTYRRVLAFLVAFLVALAMITVVQPAPKAHAAASIVWQYTYGGSIPKQAVISQYQNPSWQAPSSLLSPAHYVIYQGDGNLVEYWRGHGAFLATGTNGHPAPGTLRFQYDGHIVIYDYYGHVLWASGYYGSQYGTYTVALFDNGCFNVYDRVLGNGYPKWQWSSFGTDLRTCNIYAV